MEKTVASTKRDVFERILRNRGEIEGFGVRKLGLFGSFVRGEQGPQSDVDLLVEFEAGKKTFDGFTGLSLLLEDLLQRPVELVTTESLSPYIGPRILGEVEYVISD
jgi:predicted nucleotidyltransferase